MRQFDATQQESIAANLEQWCYEVDSEFEAANIAAVQDAVSYMSVKSVMELGCGDGAAIREFSRLGFYTTGIDINNDKLSKSQAKTVWLSDMESYLAMAPEDSLPNVFMHHSLEHIMNVAEVLELIGQKLAKGGIFYCVVPADDIPHEVHFTAFDSAEELLPKGLTPLKVERQERFGHPEFICVAQK